MAKDNRFDVCILVYKCSNILVEEDDSDGAEFQDNEDLSQYIIISCYILGKRKCNFAQDHFVWMQTGHRVEELLTKILPDYLKNLDQLSRIRKKKNI